ncbi:MAG: amidase [Alphaproteobacteria bacterium]|nr:amidase [Alphaproteobacteria bacterium]
MTDNLLAMTALELAECYERGDASPVEMAQATFDQIDRHNGTLNCICLIDEETTLDMARASEARWQKGEPIGPLDGVPVTIKDLTLTKGWPTLRGSKTTDPAGPWDEDAPATERLREAGAVIAGKTTTPEFGWKGVTDNPLTGITRNAWNPERTPGGSSGGAAAAAGAFMGPLHQGSDAAGSIRIPAAFSGVFGYKPTFGVVPNYPLPGHIGSLANMGPITRTVRDAVVMLNVLAQPDFRDFMAPPVQRRDYFDGLEDGVAGLRIAYSPTLGSDGWADDDVANAVAAAAKVFEALGATVEQVDPDIPACRPIIETIWFAADAWIVDQMGSEKAQLMDPGLLAVAEQGRNLSVQDLVGAHAARVDLGVRMARFHQTYDLLLTPQMPLEAFEAGKNYPDGRDMSEWVDWSPFTYPFNLSMQPAASVPCGFGDDGMPVAFQLVGRRFDDATVLRAARAYERAHPFKMPEGYV